MNDGKAFAGLPDVPAFQEAGVKGLVISQWMGVFVPAGTPAAIADSLNGEIGRAITDPCLGSVLSKPARSRSTAPARNLPASYTKSMKKTGK
jgi:tripartite-type tricarboxylate transporter receptor subunit TctC